MRSSVGVLGVIHGRDDRSLIGPPLLDDHLSSTIEHDIMRLVREWMVGGRVPRGLLDSMKGVISRPPLDSNDRPHG
jgi:hypothetical protein